MKKMIMLGIFMSASIAGEVAADCETETILSVDALSTLLSGNTVCAQKANGDQWQEYHEPSGKIFDYKKGPNDPVDPTKEMGTWEITDRGAICYSYGGGNFIYCYSVHKVPEQELYQFCTSPLPATGNALDVTASILEGNNGCGFN
ncbi:hypothetical protein [Methylotuvimicrobium sp. KM2]|uniref:hypothetical protein n=1 Tax=Methylotuvimicrobium sp. KM2 TaxID=3133976 RepID=UPI003101747C